MAEASACAWNDDPVSDYGIGVFQCSIYGHSLEGKSFRQLLAFSSRQTNSPHKAGMPRQRYPRNPGWA